MAIEIQFDPNQQYQRDAIDAVVELFAGQEGLEQGLGMPSLADDGALFEEVVFGNSLELSSETLRRNLRRVQERPVLLEDGTEVPAIGESSRLELANGEMPDHFNVEMETGTGKTYVYLRTIAELHRKYEFRKFVIVVPSVAIREGVLNSLKLLKGHIRDLYDGLQYDYDVYEGGALSRVRQFATAPHLQILVINIAAMTGDSNTRLIHRPTDTLNGYAPIEFLRACRPIVVMDEPQSLDGPTQVPAIDALKPLFQVGYSATPPEGAHLVHRLTPVDAYNQRLVKRIGVFSLTKDEDLNEAFVDVMKINAKPGSVTATAKIHKATRQGTKATQVTLRKDDDLFEMSGRREVYAGWSVEDILADKGVVEFANGRRIEAESTSSDSDDQQQRLMLRQAIVSHCEKELQLLLFEKRGQITSPLKPLTLFFIERVADYYPDDAKLRDWFEDEYELILNDARFRAVAPHMPPVEKVHDGYFAQARNGVPKEAKAHTNAAGEAFERIMKRKEELLSFDEPLRFIFSHSALAEGWDNPNVFTICNLQDGKSVMRKRQQVGRGLRLPVMTNGERCHVDEVNLLTVVAKESFSSFAGKLQREIEEETGVNFTGRIINVRDKKTVKLKDNVLESTDFADLWEQISCRTSYRVTFDTEAVVTAAIARINGMPEVEKAKFRLSKDIVTVDAAGVSGDGGIDLGTVESEATIRVPDVVRELCRRLPLTRATIVRILRGCDRLNDVKSNPAVFMDQVTDCMNRALYEELTEDIEYTPSGESWPASLFRDRHQDESVASHVVPVKHSVSDMVVCDSRIEVEFAQFLDERKDVPLFLKLPEWYKISTPLGNYNPDWAFVRDDAAGHRLYLVRETKGGSDIEKLQWETEGWKIRFGEAHFNAIVVDYAFGHDLSTLIQPSS
ncbi:MAG: DEAD/DEAH box helicase [Acidimicrobiia bacterium]|nr:DEAD/DEAH box helicase [Acidimicrobiia bacterium]MYC57798.1 DEAD/DEAH box helicase [Acidimicrobiia bacterium]MYH98900.1 DEAD/DEAH box helicase [Acidimicrobiia bacterium]